MYASNEELLREGECGHSNCIEDAGHKGLHSFELFLSMAVLTAEEQKWADTTMDNTKAWLVPSLRAAAGRVAESRTRERELVAALRSLETVTRSYLRYPLEGEEPGYDAKDVLAYCDEARSVLPQKKKL